MRIPLRTGLLLLVCSPLLCGGGVIAADDVEKPNVVVMMFDNLGWGELGVYVFAGISIKSGSLQSP